MILNGSDLMSFVKLDNEDKYVSLGGAQSHTLTINLDLQSFASKDFGGGGKNGRFEMKYPGLISWSCSSDHYVCDGTSVGDETSFSDNKLAGVGFDQLFDAFMKRKPVYLRFGLEGSSASLIDDKKTVAPAGGWTNGKVYYAGWAYITSLTQNAPANDWATYSIEFQGHGPLEKEKAGGTATEDDKVFDTSDTATTMALNSGVKVTTKSTTTETK